MAWPLWLIDEHGLETWLGTQPAAVRAWAQATHFTARAGETLIVRDADGGVRAAAAGVKRPVADPWLVAGLPRLMPPGEYRLADVGHDAGIADRATSVTHESPSDLTPIVLGWLLGAHQAAGAPAATVSAAATLVPPAGAQADLAVVLARVLNRARDLINAPPNLMGPAQLAAEAESLASRSGARVRVIRGRELEAANYPLIWTVGRASEREPCLIDLEWGDASAPRVTLVGKGVCFDAGGLNIKSTAQLARMKKDMAGAACALALADVIMSTRLPVRLRVLIPAVDNAVSDRSCRPSDVVTARNGLRVEIQNTDAEGRLILADALCEAASEHPDMLVDFGTLTYGATAALGTHIAAAYGADVALLQALQACGQSECDPVWPMPWHDADARQLESSVADIASDSDTPHASPMLAAWFLRRFVSEVPRWIHLDFFCWNTESQPGRPIGGEAQCVRALYRLLGKRYRDAKGS